MKDNPAKDWITRYEVEVRYPMQSHWNPVLLGYSKKATAVAKAVELKMKYCDLEYRIVSHKYRKG